MTERHKHADLIIAWANGAKIQRKSREFTEWVDIDLPRWFPHYEYRVKPEPKSDTYVALVLGTKNEWKHTSILSQWVTDVTGDKGPEGYKHHKPSLILTYDGETGKLKHAEVIK